MEFGTLLLLLIGTAFAQKSQSVDLAVNEIQKYNITVNIVDNVVTPVYGNGTLVRASGDKCTTLSGYEMYHEYLEADCPAPLKYINDDGLCDVHKTGRTTHPCQAYCQVRTNYVYAPEIPWPKSWCHGERDCPLPSALTSRLGTFYDPDNDDYALFNQGVSGGMPKAASYVFSTANTQRIGDWKCGYWTFLPIKKVVCGSSSMSVVNQKPGHEECLGDFKWDYASETVCVEQIVAANPGGSDVYQAAGENVFVHADCRTLKPLAADQQVGAYQHDGVQMPDDKWHDLVTSWADYTCVYFDHFWRREYWVTGKVFATGVIGDWGKDLKQKLKDGKCKVQDEHWQFEWDMSLKDNYEWYMNVAITENLGPTEDSWYHSCITDALAAMGGPRKDPSVCTKAG